MMNYVVATLCGISLSGSVYLAGFSPQAHGIAHGVAEECCVMEPGDGKTTAVGFDMTGKTDVKNTKCIVMSQDDVGTSKNLVEFKGNVYHICCDSCVATFNKDPEKYVKALEADPEKFGLEKSKAH